MTSIQIVDLSEHQKYDKGLPSHTHTPHTQSRIYTEDVQVQPQREKLH